MNRSASDHLGTILGVIGTTMVHVWGLNNAIFFYGALLQSSSYISHINKEVNTTAISLSLNAYKQFPGTLLVEFLTYDARPSLLHRMPFTKALDTVSAPVGLVWVWSLGKKALTLVLPRLL